MNKKDFISKGENWFASMGWDVADFQRETWQYFYDNFSGMINAPTGSGKTYSIMIPNIVKGLSNEEKQLKLIWITPIKALSKEIKIAADRAIKGLNSDWIAELRTGDTSTSTRQKQWKNPPQILITTPESIHVMMATKGYKKFFSSVDCIVVDEWHELVGNKRGVQVELALCHLKSLSQNLKIWGISATLGNMDEAVKVLHGEDASKAKLVIADIEKKVEVHTIYPDSIEKFPWSGHYGLAISPKILEIVNKNNSTLIFTNTRAQCEIWYQRLLEKDDNLAGLIAMHHGSMSKDIRDWVEQQLYDGNLKAVVCTSSLDLGVDFRPVETIVQVGSPKSVARFIQRAGRSGHLPGAVSKIYFAPTNSLELIEAAALRTAIEYKEIEARTPYIRSFDVLAQFLMTLAVSEGFKPKEIYEQVKKTHCFQYMEEDEWLQILDFIKNGGKSLGAYDEYNKVVVEGGIYKVENKGIALRHRMSIGTIISDAMMTVAYVRGKKLGVVEEWFISHIEPGSSFWFAGRPLELVRIKEMTAQVKDSNAKNAKVPSYIGGRAQLSTPLANRIRRKILDYKEGKPLDQELNFLIPLFETQEQRSYIPNEDEFLIEYFKSDEGYHLLFYPFEGRGVHEGLANLMAKRIGRKIPISFSLAMNDYGFELLSDKEIKVEEIITKELFNEKEIIEDIQTSVNIIEMARRNFRDIAMISGLIFQGYPGKIKKERHLQSSTQLLFGVFSEYEPENLLYLQTYEEIRTFQLEEVRIRATLNRINNQKIIIKRITKPSPFAFPLIVDRLREMMSTERLEDRIQRLLNE